MLVGDDERVETPGDLFTRLVDEVFRTHGALLAEGDALSGRQGLTAARWQVLGYLADGPATAAEVARRKSSKSGKGRGGNSRPKKTSASIRAANGAKVTVEHRRGVDDDTILVALADAAEQIRLRRGGEGRAA